jgi:hypothetical protein
MTGLARVVLTGASIIVLGGCQQAAAPPPPADTAQAQAPKQSPAERGKYLVEAVAGCDDCHTPKNMGPNGPEPDMTRRLSGHPEASKQGPPPKPAGGWMIAVSPDLTTWAGPWGISYTINLTPDQNTGLGIWTEDMFVRAIRQGKHMGQSRLILPPITNHVPDPVINEPPPPAPAAKKK